MTKLAGSAIKSVTRKTNFKYAWRHSLSYSNESLKIITVAY